MNKNLLILQIIVFMTITTCCMAQAKSLTFDPEYRLYTSDKVGHRIKELPELLDRLLGNGKPVILFVHGRGNEPKKSLKGGLLVEGKAVHKLEKGYDANVLMFNWDSKAKSLKDRSRPLGNMSSASQALAQVLDGVKKYRQRKPQSQLMALLVHSMGNIVVETMVNNLAKWPANRGKPLFSNVLFSASDANDLGHASWVEKVSATEKVYVSINAHDKVLLKSTHLRPRGVSPLGLEPGSILANKAIYVDITKLGSKKKSKTKVHELFNKKGMHEQVYVCEFYSQVLTGRQVLFNADNSTEIVSGRRYKLNFKRDSNGDCFK